MLRDHALPPRWASDEGLPTDEVVVGSDGITLRAARWDPPRLARLAERLRQRGARALAEVGRERFLAAWGATVEAFRDPRSPERRELALPLATLCRLSPAGLEAGLEAVLGGVRREAAEALLASRPSEEGAGSRPPEECCRPALVILASNLPALAVQPLLPALLAPRPVILKSPSAEPLFAPAFVTALARREPRLAEAVAALSWPGGDAELEAPLLDAAGIVLAYGEAETLHDLQRRLGKGSDRLVGYGPKTSLAVVAPGADLAAVARGLARDVALFDQRGCLSVAAVYALGDGGQAESLAQSLAGALTLEGEALPPGPREPAALAAVQQLRAEAELRGLFHPPLPVAVGTVLVDPDPTFRPGPGLRTVRVHPLAEAGRLPEILAPWADRLQGAALAGEAAWKLSGALTALGISRLTPPGQLQSPDATWHNGGRHPMEVMGLTPWRRDARA